HVDESDVCRLRLLCGYPRRPRCEVSLAPALHVRGHRQGRKRTCRVGWMALTVFVRDPVCPSDKALDQTVCRPPERCVCAPPPSSCASGATISFASWRLSNSSFGNSAGGANSYM